MIATVEIVTPVALRSAQGPLHLRAPRPGDFSRTHADRLIRGDNLECMEALLDDEGYAESVDLVYIDPPFLTNSDYKIKTPVAGGRVLERTAYSDCWSGGVDGYVEWLRPRLELMRSLLRPEGKIFVHCDWHANSRIRVLMDEIFGIGSFLNEIIWSYGGRGAKAVSSQFPRNHDTIYAYGAAPGAVLNKVYTERVMTVEAALKSGFKKGADGRVFKTAPRGDYTDASIEALEADGRVYRTRSGSVRIKYFLESRGSKVVERRPVGDVWDDIPDAMHSPQAERTGFATQKPAALLKRIIESATEPGGLVCDFFGGSGTTAEVASGLGRRWLVCEAGAVGFNTARSRLLRSARKPFVVEELRRAGAKSSRKAPLRPRPPRPAGRLSLERPSSMISKLPGGGVEVAVRLKGFLLPPIDAIIKENNGRGGGSRKKITTAYKAFTEAGAADFTALIDNWSVDWYYDGRVFNNSWQSVRRRRTGARRDNANNVETEARAVLEEPTARIAIRVVDVFGIVTERVIRV